MVVEILAMTVSAASLSIAAFLTVAAVRRSAEAERPTDHHAARPPVPPGPARPAPPRPPSARGLWIGSWATGSFGFAVLVAVVGSMLLSLSGGDRMIVTPPKAGGLVRHDDPELRASVERKKEYLRNAGVPRPTVAFYREPDSSAGSVSFAGGWGRIPDPGGNLRAILRSMGGSFGATAKPRSFPPGQLEGEVLCVTGGSADGDSLPVCGWADRSTIGIVMAREKNVTECADLLLRMRLDMETERT